MFSLCVGLVFRSKHVQFPIICSLQYSINVNAVEVDPHSNLLYICIVKPKNIVQHCSALLSLNQPAIRCKMLNNIVDNYEQYGQHN